eukprot:6614533-Pyramimonas_sp.AAC.1
MSSPPTRPARRSSASGLFVPWMAAPPSWPARWPQVRLQACRAEAARPQRCPQLVHLVAHQLASDGYLLAT